jgi:tetratricopeptide (TPR) repeat protein/transglutaminase-like putative cysteine protease
LCGTAAYAQRPVSPARPAPVPGHLAPANSPKSPAANNYTQEGAVIERIRANFQFHNDGKAEEMQYVRVRIQSQAAIQAWGQLIFSYNAWSDKLYVDYVKVTQPDGKVVTAPASAIRNLSSPVARIAPVYTDLRQIHVTVPDLGIGDTLAYQIRTDTFRPLIPGQFFLEWNFPRNIITLNETLTVNVPSSRPIKLKTSNGNAPPKITEQGDHRIYTWHFAYTHRPKKSSSHGKKKKKRPRPKYPDIELSTFHSWAQVGDWYATLERPRAAVTPPIRAEAALLVKGHKTELGKVKAIYDYVAENIRYVSLSFGIGQYQPHPAAEVLANQYGDCKDKATLFQSLLAAEGITSYPALISAVSKVDPAVPSPGQFDHLINVVEVGKQLYWADTTPGVTPFGLLLAVLRNKWALVIPPNKTPDLVRTPVNPPFMPVQTISIDGKINTLGGLQGHYAMSVQGDMAAVFRSVLDRVPQNDWPRVGRYIVGKPYKVTHTHFSNPADLNKPFRFNAAISAPDVINLTRKQTSFVLPGGGLNIEAVRRPSSGSTRELQLGSIRNETMEWKIQLPPHLTASLPVPVHLVRDYGEYNATYSLSGNIITAKRHLILREALLPPSRYDDYEAFRSAVLADEEQQISLTNSVPGFGPIPKGMSADDLLRAGLAAERAGHFSEGARLLVAVAKKDPNRHNIWNMIGFAYFQAQKYAKAVTAFQKQIAKNPFDPYAYNYLGSVYDAQGHYEKAIAEFKKQLQVNPLDRYAHANLANVYLLQKKYALAEAQLQSAIRLAPQNYQLDIDLGSAQLGLHKDSAALQSFQKALSGSPTPTAWNNVAYTLSQHGAHLHMAEQLSENSIHAVEAQLNGVSLETMGYVQAEQVDSIAAYWDTMAWILFREGHLKKAREYDQASWVLADEADVGEHLGRIDLKEGHRTNAIRDFALALLCPNPPVGARARLAALVGQDKVDSELQALKPDLAGRRSVTLSNPGRLKASAQFWVLLVPRKKVSQSKATKARVANVKFISGDAGLRAYEAALRKAHFPYLFAPGEQTKLVLRGKLVCKSASQNCVFTPYSADKAAEITYASSGPNSGS